jgi:hypothetical protein
MLTVSHSSEMMSSDCLLWEHLHHPHAPPQKRTLIHSHMCIHAHTYTYVHFWLKCYNITNLGFQWKILQKQRNYLTVVMSFPTHNACTENQGTFLMVDQLLNTGVKFLHPVIKIINFQSETLYFCIATHFTVGQTRSIPHLSLCHLLLHAK